MASEVKNHDAEASKDTTPVTQQRPPIYTKPTLRSGSENPSGKLGGNACCGHC